MNYFEFHIGDYLKDTAHLSLLEHGLYMRLMQVYYTREGAIPSADVGRLVGARTRDERAALDSVLGEFFVLRDGGFSQARADREIERYRLKQAKAKASADARWSVQRSQRPVDANASPDEHASDMRTHSEGNAPRARSRHQSPDPVTSTQKEISSLRDSSPGGDQLALVSTTTSKPTRRPTLPACPYDAFFAAYHEQLPELPKVRLTDNAKRKAAVLRLWKWVFTSPKSDGQPRASTLDDGLKWIRGYFGHAAQNDFVMGRTPRAAGHEGWRADFDFLLSDKGLKQVIEKTRVAA